MEEQKTTEVINEEVGEVGTQANENKVEENSVEKFTQEQVNSMLKKEKEKITNKYKDIDIAKYKEWEESQKTEEQRKAEKEAEYLAKDNQITELKRQIAIYQAGVKNSDDVDYIMFKVGKMEGEFDENLIKFLTENPKYKGEELTKEQKATGAQVKSISSNESDGVLAILKANHPEMNF